MTITRSVSIMGVPGAGVNVGAGGVGITISAAATSVVIINGLIVDGGSNGREGVLLNKAGRVVISKCVVRNFPYQAIHLHPTTGTRFMIEDTQFSNTYIGVDLFSANGGYLKGAINRVTLGGGVSGVNVGDNSDVVISESMISSYYYGISVFSSTASLHLARSTISQNVYGIHIQLGDARSSGDNLIDGNSGQDIFGTLTNVGTK